MDGALSAGGWPVGLVGDDAAIARILRQARAIAIVGASADPRRPSHGIMAYLQRQGYITLPVNPMAGTSRILGVPLFASIEQLPPPLEVLAVFRNPSAVPALVADAIAQQGRLLLHALWLQPGAVYLAAARAAAAAGLAVVVDRCLKVEHARLCSPAAAPEQAQ